MSRFGNPGVRAVVAGTSVATIGVMPVFLLGSVAVLVRTELAFTEAQLGMAISGYFAVAAVGSASSSRIVEGLGGRRALVLAAALSGVALLGMATAPGWVAMVTWLVLSGLTNAMSQLAANLRLSGAVSPRRQGLAFGIKQSSIPLVTLGGGIAVPVIGLTLGWRWVFATAAAVALLVSVLQSRGMQQAGAAQLRKGPRAQVARRPLMVLAVAGAFGAAAATSMASFLVEYAVAVGVRPGLAGVVLALGSITAVSARLAVGWLADRRGGGNLLLVTGMLVVGSAAVATFPRVSTAGPILAVTVLAYAVGWGWPGLFNFTVVRRNPQAPAVATGITQAGVYAGGVVGPLTFGLLVTSSGYPAAWYATSASLLTAAVLMVIGRSLARRAWLPPPGSGDR